MLGVGLALRERRVRLDQGADLGAGRGREAVVQQACGLLPRRDRHAGAVQQNRDQATPAAVGGADERLPGVVGVTGLAAECARVVVEQLVVVLQLVAGVIAGLAGLGRVAGEVVLLRGHDRGERRVLPGIAVEQAHVVGRRAHAGAVEAGRGGRPGVAAAQLGGQVVDLVDRGVHAADLHRQCVRRVVARVHEQAVQQVVDGVDAAVVDADAGALGGSVLQGSGDALVDGQFTQCLGRDQHLDDAGRPVPAVRILGGNDVAVVEVGQDPGVGGDITGQRWHVRCGDDSAAAHQVPAERRGRHGDRGRRVARLRHLGLVDRGRGVHAVRAWIRGRWVGFGIGQRRCGRQEKRCCQGCSALCR